MEHSVSSSDAELEGSEDSGESEYSEEQMETESDDSDQEDSDSEGSEESEGSEDSEDWDSEGLMEMELDDWDWEEGMGMELADRDWDSEDSDSEGEMMMMRLHVMRGSFFAACADLEGGCPSMDAKLWGKLPEDILWRVVQFVPVAKRFQFQSVSRKWRQMLTSDDFRNAIAATPRKSEEQGVIASVAHHGDRRIQSNEQSRRKFQFLDIDLSSFVPRWFWMPAKSHYVVAAANGLVCMANDDNDYRFHHVERQPWTTQYCVVNPLTRSCIMLPKPPFRPMQWLPPSTTTLTICSNVREVTTYWDVTKHWELATYNLGSGGGWEVAAYRLEVPVPGHAELPVLCDGECYFYYYGKVHVLAPGANGLPGEVVASVDEPSVTLLGMEDSSYQFDSNDGVLLVHRRTVFFVARMWHQYNSAGAYGEVACGVWRLVRDRMEWEAAARLDVPELERLTGVGYSRFGVHNLSMSFVSAACAVRELLCCHHTVRVSHGFGFAYYLLGFDLDTGKWSVVETGPAERAIDVFELRPDLFLSRDSLQG